MVIHRRISKGERLRAAFAMLELVVGMGILTVAMLPIAYSFVQEQRAARAYYWRAIAMELIDGEMEVLAAGGWRSYSQGPQPFQVHGRAATNLPPGQFELTIDERQVRLQWRPNRHSQGGPLSRQWPLPLSNAKAVPTAGASP